MECHFVMNCFAVIFFYHIIQDIPYGRNDRCLDLYFPLNSNSRSLKPVVVFVYGGTWSSGDKSMYGLLCSQVADALQAIVCCPNYSLYPQVGQPPSILVK